MIKFILIYKKYLLKIDLYYGLFVKHTITKKKLKSLNILRSVKEYTGNSITPWDDYNQKNFNI